MDLHELLGIYMDKFGEEHGIDTATLSEDGEETLKNMVKRAISNNEPITKKELKEFFGYDPDQPNLIY